MWSVGAILELDDRVKLEAFIRESIQLDLPVIEDGSGNTMFEFFVGESGTYLLCKTFTAVETYLGVKSS